MRESISFTATDNTPIKCILDAPDQAANKIVVFVHGLTGNPHEPHYFNAIPKLLERGYAALRIWLYPGRDGRMLEQTTVQTHADDVTTVLKNVRQQYEKIALVGHSYGGPTILLSENHFADTIVLWDPTTLIRMQELASQTAGGVKICNGMTIKVNPHTRDPYLQADESMLLAQLTAPTKVIFTKYRYEHLGGEKYFDSIKTDKELTLIDSDHIFSSPGAQEKLFEETFTWLDVHFS